MKEMKNLFKSPVVVYRRATCCNRGILSCTDAGGRFLTKPGKARQGPPSTDMAKSIAKSQFHTTDQGWRVDYSLHVIGRAIGDFNLTHEAIAQILGVSRSDVSSAAGLLQEKGLIRYARGWITLLNPKGLEVFSCECYRIP